MDMKLDALASRQARGARFNLTFWRADLNQLVSVIDGPQRRINLF
jgi:hypothetical protein